MSPGMHFGPCEGELTTLEQAMASDYSWEVSRGGLHHQGGVWTEHTHICVYIYVYIIICAVYTVYLCVYARVFVFDDDGDF